MDKETRYALYKGAVGPGWWPILDKYIPQIQAIDPAAEIYIKEKLGTLRLAAFSKLKDQSKLTEIRIAAERESFTVCQCCGSPGKRRTDRKWIQTLCGKCNAVHKSKLNQISDATEQSWLADNPEQ